MLVMVEILWPTLFTENCLAFAGAQLKPIRVQAWSNRLAVFEKNTTGFW
uniref:Uncharacterized protein n=1 Tax=Arundo donax TaxID=35708 RepID=A0A0A9EC39_ARUDO